MKNVCRECKQPLSDRRQYCANGLCGRMHAQRASKVRRGLIRPRHCPARAQALQACAGCLLAPSPAAKACDQCHNLYPARPCGLARRVRYHGQTRQRRVVPIDCKECPHSA